MWTANWQVEELLLGALVVAGLQAIAAAITAAATIRAEDADHAVVVLRGDEHQ